MLQSFQGLILKFHAGVRQIAREDPGRQTLERALDYADEVLAEGRDRIRNLRTPTISFGGLPKAFQQVVEEAAPNRSSIFKTVVEGTVLELHRSSEKKPIASGGRRLSTPSPIPRPTISKWKSRTSHGNFVYGFAMTVAASILTFWKKVDATTTGACEECASELTGSEGN